VGAFADRHPFFAMKLVKRRTLADILAGRTDPAEDRPQLLATFLAVAQTVAYAHARGLVHRDLKPPNVMEGTEQAGDTAEQLDLAEVACARGYHSAAAHMAALAMGAEPEPAEEAPRRPRYDPACSAALAGTGKGHDDPPPDDAAREKLRRQALAWLQAELASSRRVLESATREVKAQITRSLRLWKADLDLAGVRDLSLEELAEAERAPWRALWAEVDGVLAKAGTGAPD
jgi:hypothetical protein